MSNNINPNFQGTSLRSQKRSRTEQTEHAEPINNLTGHYFQTSSTSHEYNNENHQVPYVSETQNSKRPRRSNLELINEMAKGGRTEDALLLLNNMHESPCIKKNAYNTILDALGKDGRIDEAAGLFNQMWQSGIAPDKNTYSALINGMVKAEKIDKAFNLFNKMIEYGIHPNEIALRVYGTLINGLVKVGRMDDALSILNKMHEYCIQPNVIVYNIIISYFVVNNDFNRAISYLDQAIENNIFLPNLGYKPEKQTLNLHINAIYCNEQIASLTNLDRSHIPGVSLEVAKAIFIKLITQNLPISEIIVGKGGERHSLLYGLPTFLLKFGINVGVNPSNPGLLLVQEA